LCRAAAASMFYGDCKSLKCRSAATLIIADMCGVGTIPVPMPPFGSAFYVFWYKRFCVVFSSWFPFTRWKRNRILHSEETSLSEA
jgi:hypothetical protein